MQLRRFKSSVKMDVMNGMYMAGTKLYANWRLRVVEVVSVRPHSIAVHRRKFYVSTNDYEKCTSKPTRISIDCLWKFLNVFFSNVIKKISLRAVYIPHGQCIKHARITPMAALEKEYRCIQCDQHTFFIITICNASVFVLPRLFSFLSSYLNCNGKCCMSYVRSFIRRYSHFMYSFMDVAFYFSSCFVRATWTRRIGVHDWPHVNS